MMAFFNRCLQWVGAACLIVSAPALAQSVRSVDPNDASTSGATFSPPDSPQAVQPSSSASGPEAGPVDTASGNPSSSAPAQPETTYHKDDVIGAAEGVFGRGAKGLADIIEKILRDQGEPNAYISGREASGAIGVGLRYGSGTMSHTVEGQRAVYWTGPSLGFDLGGDATKTFVLVYNLFDSQDLYRRYPQAEGRAYFVGGFSASYLRRGSVVIIPVRAGVGMRLGANIGYMKFSEKARWLPF